MYPAIGVALGWPVGHLATGTVFGPGLVPFATEVALGQVEGPHIPVVALGWGLG